MKCKKCRSGKIKVVNNLWQLFGVHSVFCHSVGECSSCGYRLSYYRKIAYTNHMIRGTGTLNLTHVDDDWIVKCREHTLRLDNPEVSCVLEKLKGDDLYMPSYTMRNSSNQLKRSDLATAFKFATYGLKSRNDVLASNGINFTEFLDIASEETYKALSVPDSLMVSN